MKPPTTVINIARLFKLPEDCVCIMRPSKWGNPFPMSRDRTRDEACDLYEQHVRRSPALIAALPELVGMKLGCVCAPRRCHGFTLIKLIREFGLEPSVRAAS